MANILRADLSETDMRNVNLYLAQLCNANLSNTDLTDANLSSADLRNANLSKSRLEGADLSRAFLAGADFTEVLMSHADLSEAMLPAVELSNADLSASILSEAHIAYSNLSGANLTGVNLSGAVLWEAKLPGVVLFHADLSEADLLLADLSEAFLMDTNLWRGDLRMANLRGADAQNAKLWGANLTDADVREANLRNADLGGTDGLQVQALARANASNATLPADVAEFDGLTVVEAASQSARKLFVSVGLACAYAALAISTESAQSDILELPIIGIEISVRGFFHVVPVLLALGFGYFHLQMQRVWEEIARLPAIFPDGKSIDQKVHPWLVTGIVRAHVPYVRDEPVRFFPLQWFIVVTLAWSLVPLTQGYFVVQFVQRYPEEALFSGWGTALVAVTLSAAALSYIAARGTLRGHEHKPFRPFADPDDDEGRRSPRGETILLIAFTSSIVFGLWLGWLAFGGHL